MSTATTSEPRTLTIEEAARALGISRYLAYEAAKSGELAGVPVLRVGRRMLIPRAALDRVLAGELALPDDSEVGGVPDA